MDIDNDIGARIMFEGYSFFEHTYPIESGYKGYILNEKGNIVAVVKLDGRIIGFEDEERGINHEGCS